MMTRNTCRARLCHGPLSLSMTARTAVTAPSLQRVLCHEIDEVDRLVGSGRAASLRDELARPDVAPAGQEQLVRIDGPPRGEIELRSDALRCAETARTRNGSRQGIERIVRRCPSQHVIGGRTFQHPPQAHRATAGDVNDILPARDVCKAEKGMRLRAELTEGPDVPAWRRIAAGVVQIGVDAWRGARAPEGIADLAGKHRRADRVDTHGAELQCRFAFKIERRLASHGSPEARTDRVPPLPSERPVPAGGIRVAMLADPIQLHSRSDARRP